MDNITIERVGNEIIARIRLDGEWKPSKTGKTEIVASSLGNQPIAGSRGIMLGINVFAYPGARIEDGNKPRK